MRVLITGVRGFVGRHVAQRGDVEVIGVGRSQATLPFRYEAIDLADTQRLAALVGEVRPDCVIHLASALHSAPERELIETNLAGTLSLLRAARDVPRVVLGSSSSVYGAGVAREDDACAPTTFYGVSKLAAEHAARVAYRGELIVARIFNVVGPGVTESHVCGRFAAQLRAGRRVLEVGSLDTTRDFIDVRDVADGLWLLAGRGRAGCTYNLGSGRETRIGEVLAELIRQSGRAVDVVHRSDVPPGLARQVADISRIRALGFTPRRTLSESLAELLR